MLSDEESVLTDLDELEDDEEESTRPTKKRDGFKLKHALKPPRATTYTVQALYAQIHNGDVILDPPYQRDVVWPREKQIQLIDSILRNFYIPPIIFAYHCEDDGTESRTCIDGKQRLTSMQLFMDGVIPHKDPYSKSLLWYKDNGSGPKKGKKQLLPEKYRTSFNNKQVVCVEYVGLKDGDERDIFRRVQLGVALTAAEKMNVNKTPRADFVRELTTEFLTEETLGNPAIPWSYSRGVDFKCIATSLLCISKVGQTTTFPGTVQLENWLSETNADAARGSKKAVDKSDGDYDHFVSGVPLTDSFRKKVLETFQTVVKLANDKRYNAALRSCPAAEKISPLEMTGIPILVYTVYTCPPATSPARGDNKVSMQRLSDLILLMRAYLHKNHKDVRSNSRVGKVMLQFCLDASKDPNGFFQENSALMSWKAPPKGISGISSTAGTSSSAPPRKRKAAAAAIQDQDEEEEDGEYSPKKSRTRTLQGARKSTGAKAPPSRQAAEAPSASTSRQSPPNPQMLPSPGPGSASMQPEVKHDPDQPMYHQHPYPPLTEAQMRDAFAQQAMFSQMMSQGSQMPGGGPGMPMDQNMMAALMARQGYPPFMMGQHPPPGSG